MSPSKHAEDEKIIDFNGRYELLTLPRDCIVELDLGCGTGSFTVKLAAKFPERQIYGADVMIGRLRKLVKKSHRNGIENLAFWRAEGKYLTGLMLPDSSLDRLHLLCPDPWPKDRHRGHRLASSEFMSFLYRVLKPGGIFHFSSDDAAYFASVSSIVEASGLFAPAPADKIAEISDIQSDFELRWLELDKEVKHLHCAKII